MEPSPSGISHDVSQAYKLYITICILLVVSVFTTCLRVFTRLFYLRVLTRDDGFIILGTCFNVIADGMELYAVRKGFGRHTKFLDTESLVLALKYMQLGVLMAALAIWSIKTSVCFFLLGLLRDVYRRFCLFIWALMAFTTLTTFIGLLLWGLQAHPLERLWDPRVKGTRRSSHDFLRVVYVFYAFNLFTDFVYSLTPIWFLRNIQISKTKKYAICAIMGSGLLLTVVVCVCIYFAPEFLETKDITWALVPEFIADCTQRHVSGIIANLPALYTLLRRQRSPPSSTQSSSVLKRARNRFESGYSSKESSKTKAQPQSITREIDIQVDNRVHNHGSPDLYGMEIGTDDNIPLKDRALGPTGY